MKAPTIPRPRPPLTSKRRIEPLVWLTFSAGGVTAAMFMPVLAFLFALAFPLGWIDPPDHDHLAAVVGHPITFFVLFGMFVLMLVHAAHRFRYTLYDGLQVKHQGLDPPLGRERGPRPRDRGGPHRVTSQRTNADTTARPTYCAPMIAAAGTR